MRARVGSPTIFRYKMRKENNRGRNKQEEVYDEEDPPVWWHEDMCGWLAAHLTRATQIHDEQMECAKDE